MFDLVVHCHGGGAYGHGHASRMLAVAKAGVRAGIRVAVHASLDVLSGWDWPCAKIVLGSVDRIPSDVHVIDSYGPEEFLLRIRRESLVWLVSDGESYESETKHSANVGYIYPHFGESPSFNAPVLMGPRYYPLRPEFRPQWTEKIRGRTGVGYRINPTFGLRDLSAEKLSVSEMRYFIGGAKYIVCPPSVVAYEAMSLGTPVLIHGDHGWPDLAQSLVDAGVASHYEGVPVRGGRTERFVDGRGADRIILAITGTAL